MGDSLEQLPACPKQFKLFLVKLSIELGENLFQS